ncbi:MAG: ester cyclase [Verrucomicrobiota bacterium]
MAPPTIDLDQLTKSHWTSLEATNVDLIADFVQKLMNEHAFNQVTELYANSRYTQHNRNIPDGIEGLVGVLKDFTKKFPDYSYDVKRIIADGDHVVFHSHATIKEADRGSDQKGLNITDTWRIEEGEIVEHWDSIQPLDSFMMFYVLLNGGKIRNAHGVF